MKFTCNQRSTVTVNFATIPRHFEVNKKGLGLYFFREMGRGHDFAQIKFNICHAGEYETNYGSVATIEPIRIHPLPIVLPPYERNEEKEVTFKKINERSFTPARNFTHVGRIELFQNFWDYPFPIRVFIICHEYGHFFYKTEKLADLWGLKKYVEMGYNNSTALYSLTKVLQHHNALSEERVNFLFKHLKR